MKTHWKWAFVATGAVGWWGVFYGLSRRGVPPPPADAPHVAPGAETSTIAHPAPAEALALALRDLASDDPAARDAANHRLASVPDDQRYLLHDLLSRTTGLAHDLIARRLQEIDERLAVDPPPISLHVQNATMTQIVQALHDSMDDPYASRTLVSSPLLGNIPYSLDVDNKPFWEIVLDLHKQHPLRLSENVESVYLIDSSLDMNPYQVKGPFLFFSRAQLSPPTRPGIIPPNQQQRLLLSVAIDPRIRVMWADPIVEPIVDDTGHVIHTQRPRSPVAPRTPGHMIHYQATLAILGSLRIPLVRYHVHLGIALAAEEADIDDVQNHIGQSIRVGSATVTLNSFTAERQTFIGLSQTAPDSLPVTYELFDSSDRSQGHWLQMESGRVRGTSLGAGGPFRLHIVAAQKLREVTVSFEQKDILIPPLGALATP